MKLQRFTLIGTALLLAACLLSLAAVSESQAIPAFSRKYRTSCATCHVAYPKLNAFGQAFRNNGYRMPGGDDQYEADDPVKLGAEPWKRLWPEAIWPGSIGYLPPISLLLDFEYMVEPEADVNNDFYFPRNVAMLTGGTFGDTISYFGRINLVAPGEDLHVHRLFGQLDGLGTNLLNVRFGLIEPRAVPFSGNRSLMSSNYLINTQTFPLSQVMENGEEHHDHDMARLAVTQLQEDEHEADAGDAHQHGGDFSLGTSQMGVEVWGVTPGISGRGGLEYAFGVVNGNGSGNFSDSGSNDNDSSKDLYWRAGYKVGGMSLLGDAATAPPQTDNWRDDSVSFGVFGYRGSAPYGPLEIEEEHHEEPLAWASIVASSEDEEDHHVELISADEKFNRFGVDFDLWWRDLNLFGAYMWGKTRMDPLVEDHATADFTGWFTEADYVIFPWLIGAVRYEQMDLPTGFVDVERWVPHVTALLRANAKFTFDAQLYPNSELNDRYSFLVTLAF